VRRLRSPTLSWKTMEMACEEQLEGFPGEGLSVLRRFALGGFVEYGGPGREREGAVSRAFPSWNRSILTEIYPCHARSCHTKCEISKLRVETPGQAAAGELGAPAADRYADFLGARGWDGRAGVDGGQAHGQWRGCAKNGRIVQLTHSPQTPQLRQSPRSTDTMSPQPSLDNN
jgi:hypothetical protein